MQRKKKCRIDSNFWLLSKDGYRTAEWLRLSTGTPIQSLALDSKTISVGNILGKDRKLTHAEIQAPHSEQQTQCLDNIQFEKNCQKLAHKGEYTLIRSGCWINLAILRKRQEQYRQHCLCFVKKWRVSPTALGVGLLLR